MKGSKLGQILCADKTGFCRLGHKYTFKMADTDDHPSKNINDNQKMTCSCINSIAVLSSYYLHIILCRLIITFGTVITGQTRPQVRELNNSIVPVWAAKWSELGEAIGLLPYELDTISENHAYHPRRSEECCKAVLKIWLERDVTASWNKLDKAISSISSSTIHVDSIKEGVCSHLHVYTYIIT